MTTFAFWNLRGNYTASWPARKDRLRTLITNMATEFGVDVFMFAESAFQPEELIAALQVAKIGRYCFPKAENKRIQIYTRFKQSALDEKYNSVDDRLTIRSLGTETTTVLLAVIHFQSQWYATPNDQAMQTQVVSRNIVQTENELGHQRTILVGDLNMNPFDPGMVHAQGLNSVMTRNLAERKDRVVAGEPYRMFYNPMWGHFGDRTPGPPGTYYYQNDYQWNVFDQVLLRPQLMHSLEELKILDSIGTVGIVTNAGRPQRSEASDHLPILFRLNI